MFMLLGRPLRAAGLAMLAASLVSAPPALADPAPAYEVLIERLARTPATLEAEALHDAAEARARQARALPNPSVGLETENAYGSGPYSGFDSAESTLFINQPLELWGQRDARIQAARAEADVAGLRRDQAHWLAAGRLALAYAEAEAAVLRHDLAREVLSLTQEDRQAARALVDEGREPALRALQADSEVAMSRALLDEARANRDAALARLSAVALLDEPATSIRPSLLDRVPGPLVDVFDEPLTIQVARAELGAARSLVTVEQRRARPDVSASLGIQRFEESRDEAFSFGLSLSVPLFDRNKGAIGAAQAQQRAAEARLAASRLEALAERQAAQASRDASHSRTQAADSGVVAAEEAYRLARIGFDAGRISLLELRSARAALISARHATVDARLARVRAEIDLARLEGRAPFGEAP